MPESCDVAIIGGGVTGLSTAIHLKQLGVANVTVVERHHTGAGQSGRAAGVLRGCVRHATVTQMQLEGQVFLREFSSRFGVPMEYHETGYLLVADAGDADHVSVTCDVATAAGCHLEPLDHRQAAEIQPGIGDREGTIYTYEPRALYVDPMPATHAMAVVARRLGVELREGCDVQRIDCETGHVRGLTTTNGDQIVSPTILVATSVWGCRQLEQLGVDVPVRPHIAQMAFFQTPPGSDDRLRCIVFDSRADLYMRPEGDAQMFVGRRESCHYEDSDAVDPDNYRQTAEFTALRQMHTNLQTTLPFMADGFVHRTYACTYDVTPDEMPIFGDIPDLGGLYYALGFSGGGFSASPWVGRRVARWIVEGKKPDELNIFRESRFRDGSPIEWANTPLPESP